MFEQARGDVIELAHAHVERQGLLVAGQAGPVQGVLVGAAVGGDHAHRLRMVAMRQGDAGIGGAGQRRGDAGHDLVRHVVRAQVFQLFAAASEDEGVAAFQAHHAPAGARLGQHEGVDARLGGVVVFAGQLAHGHAFSVAARQRQHALADQAVVQDDVGFIERAQRLERQQAGVARARAHQHDAAPGGGLRRAQRLFQFLLGQPGLLLAQARRDRAVEQPVVETPSLAEVGAGGADARPIARRQGRQLAERMVEQRLDALAQAPRQHRRHARGGDGHDQRRPVDDGRHLEGRQFGIVDHVAEYPARPRGLADRRVDGAVVGGGHHQPGAGQPGGFEAAVQAGDAALLGQGGERRIQARRAHDDLGAGLQQGLCLADGDGAAAYHQYAPPRQVGENREQRHGNQPRGKARRMSADHRDRGSSLQLSIS